MTWKRLGTSGEDGSGVGSDGDGSERSSVRSRNTKSRFVVGNGVLSAVQTSQSNGSFVGLVNTNSSSAKLGTPRASAPPPRAQAQAQSTHFPRRPPQALPPSSPQHSYAHTPFRAPNDRPLDPPGTRASPRRASRYARAISPRPCRLLKVGRRPKRTWWTRTSCRASRWAGRR